MKIAVLLTGFLRSHLQVFPLLKNNLLDLYDCDVYCGTWDTNQWYINQPMQCMPQVDQLLLCYAPWKCRSTVLSMKHYMETKESLAFSQRLDDVFKTNTRAQEHGSVWVERLRDHWWLVQQIWNLIENPQMYDAIIRLRFDIELLAPLVLSTHPFVIPQDIGGWDFSDHCAYGNPDVMKKYCNLYNNIPSLYYDHNIDISHAVDMVKFYMTEFETATPAHTDITWKYRLIK